MDTLYRSKPLDTTQGELRLITIQPDSNTGCLSCTLDKFSLRDFTPSHRIFLEGQSSSTTSRSAILRAWLGVDRLSMFPESSRYRFCWGDYSALSYAWGDPNNTTKILVNMVETQVTTNLAEALYTLRETGLFAGRFRLWVDALCINQKDSMERSAQVSVMQVFYSHAWTVVGFLGPQQDGSDKALDLIHALSDIHDSREKCEELVDSMMQGDYLHTPGSWLALKRLTLRPYWERVWIMQEVALGGARTVLFCGSKRISWQTFGRGLAVMKYYLWIPRHRAIDRDRHLEPNLDTESGWYETRTLNHIWSDLWQLSQADEARSKPANLTRLMEMSSSCKCSDARDKIYGLLGVMDPVLARAIQPDYTDHVTAVFTKAAESHIDVYKNLELLRDTNIWGRRDLPSWVPDWTWQGRSRDSRPDDFFQPDISRPNSGDVSMERRSYCADRGLSFTLPQRRGDYLMCQAVQIDAVDGLGYNPEAENPEMIQSRGNLSAYGDSESSSRQLAIALYADRRRRKNDSMALLNFPLTMDDADQQFRKLGWKSFIHDLDHYYSRWTNWFSTNASFRVGGRDLQTYFSGNIPGGADANDYWSAYQGWVRTALAGPRRLVTTNAGRVGWVECARGVKSNEDIEVRRDDVFAVFPGCSVPILLRPTEECGVFRVVGEAYLQGVMEGEVQGLIQRKQCELQWVQLC